MIRKSGYRFSEKIMLKQKIERDDDSKKSHPALGGLHRLHGVQHSGSRMTVDIFEELFVGAGDRNLVIEPQLRCRSQGRQIFHGGTENPDMSRMRFSPSLQGRQAFPPAHAI